MPDENLKDLSRMAHDQTDRISRAHAELRQLAWDLLDMEFTPATSAEQKERFHKLRGQVNETADRLTGADRLLTSEDFPLEVAQKTMDIADTEGKCPHCGGSGVRCCEFGAAKSPEEMDSDAPS